MQISKPNPIEYDPYYEHYISLVAGDDLLVQLSRQIDEAIALAARFENHGDYAYAEGKWTVKQVLQHLIDTERIFAYRALRICRGDETPLAGFDQDEYAETGETAHRTLEEITAEMVAVRSATYSLLNGLTPESTINVGIASNAAVSGRALFYMIIGHMAHHMSILTDRYTPGLQ